MSDDNNTINSEKLPESISYVAYEAAIARAEKRYCRIWILLIVTVGLWFATIIAGGIAFMWYLTLPVEETYENVKQSTNDGGNNLIGGDYYGDTDTNKADDPKGKSSEEKTVKDKQP